ncbi:DNA-binding domain-containing protein, partial [Flavobacterium sp. LAR06]
MSRQEAFASALLSADETCPPGVFSRNGADPASRFAVYRNNVHSSLINALADSYPVTRQLVGDHFFRAMAGVYIQVYPPISPLLHDYGSDLADFIQGFAPAAEVP